MLRDLFFFSFLGAAALFAFKRPFIFVLLFIYVDILSPQTVGTGLISRVPLSLLAFAAATGGWLLLDRQKRGGLGVTQGLILMLLLYCAATTVSADFPAEAAAKWSWVWKVLVFAMFLPVTLSSRARVEATIATLVLSGSAMIVAAGIKTFLSGGGYGALAMLRESNSGLTESSIVSCFAIAIIPLILFLTRRGEIVPLNRWSRLYGLALCFACLLIPIGTEARTGLMCAAILALTMLRFVRYRMIYIGLLAGLVALSPIILPESFLARMSTIETARADSSASVRLAVWAWTLDYAVYHPMGGGFDSYLGNNLRLELEQQADLSAGAKGIGDAQSGVAQQSARAFHSAYFEMLGEQGWPGLILWLAIHAIGLVRMEILFRRYRHASSPDQGWISALALALQQAHLVYLTGAAFVGIAYQPFAWLIVALEAGLVYVARQQARTSKRTLLPLTAAPMASGRFATFGKDARLEG